jgi:hypothetical protein
MKNSSRLDFKLRPHDTMVGWESNDEQYFMYAQELLPELELLSEKVKSQWPVAHDQPIKNMRINYPELKKLMEARNRASDSVCIYAAMAIEGFLNRYGVLRLGQTVYNKDFERLTLVPKLRMLLLVCDSIVLKDSDSLIVTLNSVAKTRNDLVHPKAKEISEKSLLTSPSRRQVPYLAREAVDNMKLFFVEFTKAVPAASKLTLEQ